MEIARCEDVSFSYREGKPVLRHIDLSIQSGETIALLGPNGAGKSTLLNCLVGLLRPQGGTVWLKGEDIRTLSRKTIARSIAYVAQRPEVSFDYSVLDYVTMGRTAYIGTFGTPTTEDYERSREALRRLDIVGLSERSMGELSGGEQQRVCIARAIVQDPQLILFDEPTSALDYGNQIKVLGLIRELTDSGYSVLFTTHNPNHCLMLHSKVAVLRRDGTLEVGNCDQVISEDLLRELYNVDVRLLFIPELNQKVCIQTGF